MNSIFVRKSFFSLSSLAALAVIGSSLPATAQTTQTATTAIPDNQVSAEPAAATIPEAQQQANTTTEEATNPIITPVPGTIASSSIMLDSQNTAPNDQRSASQLNQIAQADINPGRATRGVSSYVGIGGNIGVTGGSSPLADGNFAVISKVGFTKTLSARPGVILGDDALVFLPVTYDFSFKQGDPFSEPLPIAPYVGVGAVLKTGDKSEAAVLVTGGFDLPLNEKFTATAAVNAGFFDKTDVGVLFGVGYNFSGF